MGALRFGLTLTVGLGFGRGVLAKDVPRSGLGRLLVSVGLGTGVVLDATLLISIVELLRHQLPLR